MVNFGLLTAGIRWRVWGTPANFNGFRVLAALLHGTLVVGVSQTLRHWTDSATYIRQGGHHVGHWPTFLVVSWLPWQSANWWCVVYEGVSFVLSCSAWTAVNHGKPLHVHKPVCSVSFYTLTLLTKLETVIMVSLKHSNNTQCFCCCHCSWRQTSCLSSVFQAILVAKLHFDYLPPTLLTEITWDDDTYVLQAAESRHWKQLKAPTSTRIITHCS